MAMAALMLLTRLIHQFSPVRLPPAGKNHFSSPSYGKKKLQACGFAIQQLSKAL